MVSNEKTYKYNMKRIAVLAVIILVTFISLWIILNKYMLSVIGRQAKSSVSDIVMQQANVISTIINDISLSTENTAKVLEKSNGDEYSKYLNTVNYASAVGITDNEGNVICGDKIDVEMDYYQKLIIYSEESDSFVFSRPFISMNGENLVLVVAYGAENIKEYRIPNVYENSVYSFMVNKDRSMNVPILDAQKEINLDVLEKTEIDFEGFSNVNVTQIYDRVFENTSFYLALGALNVNDWYVAMVVPYTAVVSNYFDVMRTISTMTFVLMLLFVSLILYIEMANQKNNLSMYHLAYVDKMTGLPTWNKMQMDMLPVLNQENKKDRYALVAIDIDDFKTINQLLGYSTGNNILCTVAEYIKNAVSSDEYVCRITGECFFVMMIHNDTDEAIAERLYRTLENAIIEADSKKLSIGFTCGVNRIFEGSLESMLDGATIAKNHVDPSYRAKIGFYDEQVRKKTLENKELESSLESALANNEFLVYLQPKYSFKTGELTGAEALVRWNHPKRGMISPGVFIPIFEANGNIDKIDSFVFETICQKLHEWLEAGIKTLPISVNLSRLELISGNIGEILSKMVKKYDVPFDMLDLELTETVAFTDSERLMKTMTDLKELGFKLSIDDFGSGYSSLSLLEQMPFDTLKLDRSFIMDWDSKSDQKRKEFVVKGIITMAKHLNITTLMEGVETKEQSDFLKIAGCDLVQGFYYGKPMPIQEYENLIKKIS